jgi:hypothetical protein
MHNLFIIHQEICKYPNYIYMYFSEVVQLIHVLILL